MGEWELIGVPVWLLIINEVTASAKVIWMALHIASRSKSNISVSNTSLAIMVGLTRLTVRRAKDKLTELGWCSSNHAIRPPRVRGRTVHIPIHLVFDRTVSARAKVIYGVVRDIIYGQGRRYDVSYASIAKECGRNVKTVRNAIDELSERGWLIIEQKNQLSPLNIRFRNPVKESVKAEMAAIEKRLNKAEFIGEALMREYLSVLVDSKHYVDGAYYGFLYNGYTDKHMQLDRFYYNNDVAFEFNGEQHYSLTDMTDIRNFEKQLCRDAIKKDKCAGRSINLIIVRPQDLSFQTMLEKVKGVLPLRKLTYMEPIIQMLETRSKGYIAKTTEALEKRAKTAR